MKSIVIIGVMGAGKTTYTKTLLKKIPKEKIICYDIYGEYKDTSISFSADKYSIEQFSQVVSTVKNKVILYEDATLFFNNRSSGKSLQKLISMFVKCRHNNNFLILLYHSIHTIPLNVFSLVQYICLLKTKDNIAYIEKKYSEFPELINFAKLLKTEPPYAHHLIKNL